HLDQTLASVRGERREFMDAIEDTVDAIGAGRADTLTRAEGLVDQLYQLGQDVTFRGYPVVFRYRGTVISPIADTEMLRIRIQGANLRHGDPYLEFNDNQYRAVRTGSQSLLIEIPRDDLPEPSQLITSSIGSLVLFRKTGGFLGLFRTTREVRYDINFLTLPRTLGTVDVQYDSTSQVRRENIIPEFEFAHNGTSGCRSFARRPATPERRFDVERSSIHRHSGNSRGDGRDISITSEGVSMRICVSRRTLDRDNGFAHYRVNLVEYWYEDEIKNHSASSELSWASDTAIALGDRVSEVIATVTTFNGSQQIMTPSSTPLETFYSVDFDDQNVLIVRPRVPAVWDQL
ncbi:MAG: hypothetical protein AAFS13_07480, partial [Pseudomonadota bacterium]